MSILVKEQIIELIRNKELSFSPGLDELQLRPHAVDLRLGFSFRIPKTVMNHEKGRSALTLDYYALHYGQYAYFDEITLHPGHYFDVLPGESVMGFSLEKIDLRNPILMGIVYPRSSVNRRGLAVDLTGIVDAGYSGHLMFPIHNNTSRQIIRLYPGERFCQIVFEKLDQPVLDGYQGRYAHQAGKKVSPAYLPEANEEEIKLIRAGNVAEVKKKFAADI